MKVKLKRGNDIQEIDIVIAPDFILVYNLIKEGYRVIEVNDEFYTYKEKWNSERDVEHEKRRKEKLEEENYLNEKLEKENK